MTAPLSFFGVKWGSSSKPPARGRGSGPNIAALTVDPNKTYSAKEAGVGKAFSQPQLGANGKMLLSLPLRWFQIQLPVAHNYGQYHNIPLFASFPHPSFLLPGMTFLNEVLAQKTLSQSLLSGKSRPSQTSWH
jgi:hypothetical protein